MAFMSLKDIDVSYDKKKQILKGLNLDVEKGELVSLLGPSGCGKSTTLRILGGFTPPDKGNVIFDGQDITKLPPNKRQLNTVFQKYALFPHMTIAENIAFGLKIKNKPKSYIDDKIKYALKLVNLSGFEKRDVTSLSGGQQQRTALARILAYEPAALLLDEPFSAMDAYLKERLRLELKKTLSEYEGVSVMVTHDRDEAFQLCDHLLLMEEGRVIAAGETKAVFADPGTWQAARLTGCKNLSRIEKIGSRKIRALDWDGLELVTAQEVGVEIEAVGIRAHDFEPLSSGEALEWEKREDANLIPVEDAEISEMPFEWYVTMKNHLWWKIEKTIHVHESAGLVPEYLRISPEAIVLLRTDH